MEEQKKGIPAPEWLMNATAWQEEDPQNRSLITIAVSELNAVAGCGGNTIALTNAIVVTMSKDPDFRKCVERAVEVINDPIKSMAFGSAAMEYAKERGYFKQ